MTNNTRLGLLVCVGVLGVGATPVAADEFASRGGPSIGFGLGVVRTSCADTDCSSAGTGAFDLHVGTMFSPRLGVTLDVWGMADEGDESSVQHGIASIGPRFWLLPQLWVHAGLGIARVRVEPVDIDIESRTAYDVAWLAAAGWEVFTVDDLTFDVQVRAGASSLTDDAERVRALGLAIGVNWY